MSKVPGITLQVGRIDAETDKAWLLHLPELDEGGEEFLEWLPKSRCRLDEARAGVPMTITIPGWLVEQKALNWQVTDHVDWSAYSNVSRRKV